MRTKYPVWWQILFRTDILAEGSSFFAVMENFKFRKITFHLHTGFYISNRYMSDKLISPNMYECLYEYWMSVCMFEKYIMQI